MRARDTVTAGAAAVLALLACGIVVPAQTPSSPQTQGFTIPKPFKSGIELISITATVTDADGRLITGLPREAFEVFEDGEPQTITHFTNERVPVGLGLLLDVSDSMFGQRITDARAAVDRFLFDLLDPADNFFVFAFNHRPKPLTAWTRARDEVQRALAGVQPSGGTAIYDTLIDSLPLITTRTRERAAVVIISDGADTASNATLRDVGSALLRSDAFVYAVAIDSPEHHHAINTGVNPTALREITGESGGRTEIVRSSADLEAATARIAEELNSQYVIGYTSSHPDGRFHSIRVRSGNYRVRARRGYVRENP